MYFFNTHQTKNVLFSIQLVNRKELYILFHTNIVYDEPVRRNGLTL